MIDNCRCRTAGAAGDAVVIGGRGVRAAAADGDASAGGDWRWHRGRLRCWRHVSYLIPVATGGSLDAPLPAVRLLMAVGGSPGACVAIEPGAESGAQ